MQKPLLVTLVGKATDELQTALKSARANEIELFQADDLDAAVEASRQGVVLLFDSTLAWDEKTAADLEKLRHHSYLILVFEEYPASAIELERAQRVDEVFPASSDPSHLGLRLAQIKRLQERIATDGLRWAELAAQSDQTAAMNDALSLANQRFGELFHGLPVACFTFGPDGLVQDWNRAAEELFEVQGYLAYQQPLWEVLKAGGGVWTARHVKKLFKNDRGEAFDWTLRLPGNWEKSFACTLFMQRDRQGQPQGFISANLDITERKQAAEKLQAMAQELSLANRRLEEMASTDMLTGLANRRSFEELLAEGLDLETGEFSLILLDVDHFKSFNDTFGHQVGDIVLRTVGRLLKESIRDEESACRYGGEEFAILLRNTSAARAMARANAFRAAVEGAEWPRRAVTISLGVETFEGAPDRAEAVDIVRLAERLIHNADAALYRSKELGRNRSTHFSELSTAIAA